jgi:hypothetical protein
MGLRLTQSPDCLVRVSTTEAQQRGLLTDVFQAVSKFDWCPISVAHDRLMQLPCTANDRLCKGIFEVTCLRVGAARHWEDMSVARTSAPFS